MSDEQPFEDAKAHPVPMQGVKTQYLGQNLGGYYEQKVIDEWESSVATPERQVNYLRATIHALQNTHAAERETLERRVKELEGFNAHLVANLERIKKQATDFIYNLRGM